jgi:hypothetical protein
MSEETIDLNLLFAGDAHSVLERTLMAEYLLARGYLVSDLESLPAKEAKRLMSEAVEFSARRFLRFEFTDRFHGRFRLPFSMI